MKKIGLILEGKTAHFFLEKLLNEYHSSNFYTIITQDLELIPQTHPDNFTFHCFDPTSISKLKKVFLCEIDSFFLIYKDEEERKIIYSILRELFPKTPIILDTQESLDNHSKILEEVSIPLVVTNKLLTFLPNVPTPIQDIGLGRGEIMEIPVPSGSVYCYRTLSSISQKEWRIVGIYRNEELLLSSYSLSIQPNDKLLAIGNPHILNNVYRQITSSLGQFPIPFGKDLFLYLDEDLLDENEILKTLSEALFLHQALNSNQLIITLLNPRSFSLIQHIKSIQNKTINVLVDYNCQSLSQILHQHHQKRIGLAILHYKLFHLPEIKKTLFDLNIPTFKTAKNSIADCSSCIVFLGEEQAESIAPITLDIASQLKLSFKIYDFDVDANYHKECLESYKNLSQIFNKTIELHQSNTKNPVIYCLELSKPILQFLPFDPIITSASLLKIASTHTSYHLSHLDKNPQILLPVSYENS